MRFILLLLLFLTSNTFAARTETIDADCVRIQDGTCIDKNELGYVDGVTSAIQVQLDAKAATITNSAGLAGQLSDETGTGLAVFGTSPNITTPTGIVKGDVGLGNVDNTSDATKNAASVSLTNKTIDADLNTITNIENADIKAAAAIDATKIADGTVTSSEFQYLGTVTSDVQTQIGTKVTGAASSVASEFALMDGTTGKLIKSATGTGFVKSTSGVYSTVSNIDLAADVSTTLLPVANGGGNKALTLANGGVLWTDADSFEVTAAGTSGQVLRSNGAAAPSWFTSSLTDITCRYGYGQTGSTLAAPIVLSSGTALEVIDSCATGSAPAFSSTGYAVNMAFGNGTFANSTPVICDCEAYRTASDSPVSCDTGFATGDQTWSSTASGGFTIGGISSAGSTGTQQNSYVILSCTGAAP
jgi:hypothetical protein